MKEGDEKVFFETGSVAAISSYRNDLLHGTVKNFNVKGHLIFEADYTQGVKSGKFNKYYDDGRLKLSQNFVEDKLHGVKRVIDEYGHIEETRYENGVRR
jgi:antitoxin component YwqK of YwqJK toxin-antitoxin module